MKIDYYAVLGVLPSVDADALRAIYISLQKKYHPDVFRGNQQEAERITKLLNEAYAVLSDPEKRKRYDQERATQNASANDFFSDQNDTKNSFADQDVQEGWVYVSRYFPDAESRRKELANLSPQLAFAFQVSVITQKAGPRAEVIGNQMKEEFLHRYFGDNMIIHSFVVGALNEGRRDVAIEVNNAISMVGNPNSSNVADFLAAVRQQTGYKGPAKSDAERAAADNIMFVWVALLGFLTLAVLIIAL